MEQKECPLCSEMMKIEIRETIERIPGSPQEVKRKMREWVCPECDYFEEDEDKPRLAANERPE